jgi:hypothetical protein
LSVLNFSFSRISTEPPKIPGSEYKTRYSFSSKQQQYRSFFRTSCMMDEMVDKFDKMFFLHPPSGFASPSLPTGASLIKWSREYKKCGKCNRESDKSSSFGRRKFSYLLKTTSCHYPVWLLDCCYARFVDVPNIWSFEE